MEWKPIKEAPAGKRVLVGWWDTDETGEIVWRQEAAVATDFLPTMVGTAPTIKVHRKGSHYKDLPQDPPKGD